MNQARSLAVCLLCACAAGCGDDDPIGGSGDGGMLPDGVGGGDASGKPEWPALQTAIPTWEVTVDEAQLWALYDENPWFDTYIDATFTAGGFTSPVTLRWRGAGARTHPKKSWKIKFPETVKFEGRRRLNLIAEYLDGGLLTDKLALDLMAAAGVRAPRATYVNLVVNGEYRGVYTEVEDVDKMFLDAHELDGNANIYRCGSRDCEMKVTPPATYQYPWEKKTNETEPWDDLDQFLDRINHTMEGDLEGQLPAFLALDEYLRYMAASILISNFGIDDSGSFVVHDQDLDRWHYVPWDLNNAKMIYWSINAVDEPPLVDRPVPFFTAYDPANEEVYGFKVDKFGAEAQYAWSVLSTRIWDRPALRRRVIEEVATLRRELLDGRIDARIDAMDALIAADRARDPYVSQPHADHAADFLKDYWRGRLVFLDDALPAEESHGEGPIVISRLTPAAGGVEVEVTNRGASPVDVAGWTITTDLREQFQQPLGVTGMLAPGEERLLLLAADPAGGEVGIFDGVHRWMAIDVVYWGALPAGGYARRAFGEDWGQ
jgi:spore coat protein H